MTTLLCVAKGETIAPEVQAQLDAAGVVVVPLRDPQSAKTIELPTRVAPRTPDEPKSKAVEDAIKARAYDERAERACRLFANQMRARGTPEVEIARAIERGSVRGTTVDDELGGIVS